MPTHGTATKVQQNRLGGGDVENKVSYRLINLNTITGQDNPISDESANLDSNIAADFTGLGGSASRLSDLDTFESIQAEFDKIQGDGDNNVTGGESSLTVGGGQLVNQHGQNPITITTIPISSVGAVSLAGQTQVSSAQTLVSLNAQPVVTAASLHNSQVLATTQTVTSEGKTLQSVVKRPLVSASSGQVVTKVIITKNPNTNQPQAVSLALSQPSQTAEGVSIATLPQTVTVAHPGSLTPTKTITISQAGVLSPSKVFSTVTGTPTKQVVPANRIALSPIKSPAKVTMIPVSLAKSPQRIAPAPAPGHMVTMVAKSVVSPSLPTTTVTTSTAKPATITMSPSKVIIRQQAGGLGKPLTAKQVLPISATPNVQPMQVSGSRFQYVRLVTAPASQVQNSTGAKLAPAPLQAATVVPASTAMAPKQMKITVPVAPAQVAPKPVSSSQIVQQSQSQRILLPATSTVNIRPSASSSHQAGMSQLQSSSSTPFTQLPPGTTIISSGQNMQGVQGFALVPAQYVAQLQQQINQQQQQPPQQQRQESSFVPIASNDYTAVTSSRHGINGSVLPEAGGQRPRKPCNCTKSQCLKLYCDCFANGEFCHNCNCNNCANNLEHEDERSRAIKACLDRNPHAFHPKIGKSKGKGKNGEGERRHNKGCNCKRSGCLKNYCECYEAKIMCSSICKCVGCKNFEESPERKTLMHLADAAEVRVQQQTAAKTKLSSQIQDLPTRAPLPSTGERLPYSFVTSEVAEATCSCLLAQAEESERTRQMEIIQERLILEEFGRCLMSVIESANKTKVPSPVP